MCGLVGIAGDTSGTWKDVFADLLLFDVVRGPHSTGVGFVGRYDEKFEMVKRVGHPFNVFDTVEFEAFMDTKHPTKAILGHNRFATYGEKTEENAHPFAFKNVMGMHNGTLDKWAARELVGSAKYGTDSEAIFATINQDGLDKTLDLLSGAWALVWFDKKKHTLNFLRNVKRPLHYCYSKDRCTIIWASELDMLKYVMDRRNKEPYQKEYYVSNSDEHLSWEIPMSIAEKIQPPTRTPAVGKGTFVWKGNAGFSGGSNISTGATTSKNGFSTQTHIAVTTFDKRIKTKKFRPPYKDMYGKVINKNQFTKLVEEGCCFCGRNEQKWGQFIYLMSAYTDCHTPYTCDECFDDAEIYPYSQYAI